MGMVVQSGVEESLSVAFLKKKLDLGLIGVELEKLKQFGQLHILVEILAFLQNSH